MSIWENFLNGEDDPMISVLCLDHDGNLVSRYPIPECRNSTKPGRKMDNMTTPQKGNKNGR